MFAGELPDYGSVLQQEIEEILRQNPTLVSGRARGAGQPSATHQMFAAASLLLDDRPPRVLGARPVPLPAAASIAGVKLNQLLPRLRAEREALGLTLQDLHDTTGITCGRLSRLENGIDTNPTIGTLERIAASLGIELLVSLAATENQHAENQATEAPPTEIQQAEAVPGARVEFSAV